MTNFFTIFSDFFTSPSFGFVIFFSILLINFSVFLASPCCGFITTLSNFFIEASLLSRALTDIFLVLPGIVFLISLLTTFLFAFLLKDPSSPLGFVFRVSLSDLSVKNLFPPSVLPKTLFKTSAAVFF